jgi:hypothetical protein
MKLTIEDVVICLALLLGFSTSLLMAIANQSWGTSFPPSLIAFFACVSVAALIYRFLGGSGDAQFKMGVLQVTGSAAVLLGGTWLLGDRIGDETVLYRTESQYRPKLEARQQEVTRLRRQNLDLTRRADILEGRVAALGSGKDRYTIEEVRRMAPDDEFVTGIRRMVANEDPPFRDTIRNIPALVTLNDAMIDSHVYRICSDKQEALFAGLETQKNRLRMRRTFGEGETRTADMERGGLITQEGGVCPTDATRTFDIQITCADARTLFPDRIERCAGLKAVYLPGFNSIRGQRVMLGALPPQ